MAYKVPEEDVKILLSLEKVLSLRREQVGALRSNYLARERALMRELMDAETELSSMIRAIRSKLDIPSDLVISLDMDSMEFIEEGENHESDIRE